MLLRLLFALLLIPWSLPAAHAQDRGEQPWRADISASGNYFSGNLSQIQALGRAHLSYSGAQLGGDLLATGFRLWMRPAPGEDYLRVGDDLGLSLVPFYYLKPRFYLMGFGRYERSQLRQLDARYNAGAGPGFAPVRRPDFLIRAALLGHIEHARYPTSDLTLDQEGPTRTVPRVAIQSNGWMRRKDSPLTLRYVATGMVNPVDLADARLILDASLDLKVKGGFSTRATWLTTWDTVVPEGVQPADIRATLGLAWQSQRPG